MVTHAEYKVKVGHWVRARVSLEENPDYYYVVEGVVWEHPGNEGQAAGLYVGDLWLPHRAVEIIERHSSPPQSRLESPTQEFVLIENGKETDWVDPVLEFTETDDGYKIWNGYSNYWFAKGPGITHQIRMRARV